MREDGNEESDWRQEAEERAVKMLLLQHQGHGYLITVAEGLKVSKQIDSSAPSPALAMPLPPTFVPSTSRAGWQALSWLAWFPI